MRRLLSGRSRVSGPKAFRLLMAAAVASSLPLAVAPRAVAQVGVPPSGGYAGHIASGHASHYGQSFAGYSAPNFVSTFGPHSITGTAGANFVAPSGRLAPDFASSWGVAHPVWRGQNGGWGRNRGRDRDHDRDHDGDHDRGRSRFFGYGYPYLPIYNGFALMPGADGYSDVSGSSAENSQNGMAAGPEYNEPAPQQDEYRPPYAAPESDYAPPPPVAAAATVSSTVLDSEPALTLIFKDGHQQSIRNYALTGDAVLVFDKAASGRQQRIPLAALDLPATEQAAQAAGLEFTPPR